MAKSATVTVALRAERGSFATRATMRETGGDDASTYPVTMMSAIWRVKRARLQKLPPQ